LAKLPAPPHPLPGPAITTTLGPGVRLWRVYFAGGTHPAAWNGFRSFGPTHARFDHHDLPKGAHATRAIFYAADDLTTCLAEVFQAKRIINRMSNAPRIVGFDLVRDVLLLDLTGHWPTQAGASMAISSGRRDRARQWSRAIYAAYPNVEGLFYGSSMHANRPTVALYERAQTALPPTPALDRALDDAALRGRLNAAATRLGYGIV
jgi:hypothetical protein